MDAHQSYFDKTTWRFVLLTERFTCGVTVVKKSVPRLTEELLYSSSNTPFF